MTSRSEGHTVVPTRDARRRPMPAGKPCGPIAAALLAGCIVLASPVELRAQSAASGGGEAPDGIQRARAEFVAATDHVKNARWAEALAAFERSAALRAHPLTTYNIGACERALGRYTRARTALKRALEESEAAGGGSGARELPKSFGDEAQRWIGEIDALLVRADVTLTPADTVLLIDGAPLARGEGDALVAGLPNAKDLARTPGGRFTLLIDPGDHLISLSRPGFVNAIVQKAFAPGARPTLKLDLESLPATLRILANQPGAAVSVDGLDTGVAPVELARPAGTYRVAVRKEGFVPYVTTVRVNAGDRPTLQATLTEETRPLYKSPWFWTAAAAIVAGATVTTYVLTRPAPERPAPDGGGLGWVVSVPAPAAK